MTALSVKISTIFWAIVAFCASAACMAQEFTVEKIDSSQRGVSFRGMSAPGNAVVWVSGSKGTIGRSVSDGRQWEWFHPAGYEQRDFRDIEAFDANTAVAMAVDSPGIIIKTIDGGKTWRTVYEDHHPGVFLDAMAFRGKDGFCIGDPADGRFWVLQTDNFGDTWQLLPAAKRPYAREGEACFAASGTNIVLPEKPQSTRAMFVTGGRYSRLFVLGKDDDAFVDIPLPLQQGATMTGANSIISLSRFPVVAGGDYENRGRADSTIYLPDNLLEAGKHVSKSPLGYTSCLAPYGTGKMIVCGLNGVAIYQLPDAVLDKGDQWDIVDRRTWHVVMQAADAKAVFFAGPNGSIGKLTVNTRP